MAPQATHTIDRTEEYNQFIQTLQEYHAKRGTNFDPEPKVGQTPVDLLKLFKLIVQYGGYDKVSEEKLAWRNMVNFLSLYSSNEASAAYSLKLAYYKNLAAYEITTVHKKEPPPPEILEHISAKGGGLLTRTLENFGHRAMRPSNAFSEDAGTPTPTRRPEDGAPLSGRAQRGLRESPQQRILFQPDTGPARQTRHSNSHHGHGGNSSTPNHSHTSHSAQSHHPSTPQFQPSFNHNQVQQLQRGASLIYNPPGSDVFSPVVQNFEPRPPVALTLQTVDAPSHNQNRALQQRRVQRLQAAGVSLIRFATRPPVPPGNEGPNIYIRCLGALRSGIPSEEAFALSHLVKISFERGDKYKFESFPGLAEGLLEKALQVGSLFYHDVRWTISYDIESDEADLCELDGINGTPDILDRISQLRPRDPTDAIQPEDFADSLVLVTEAALTIRNMVTLPENAYYLSDFPPSRDFLCIVLNLPNKESVVELKHYALDIAEQITPFLTLGDDDPLYQTLLRQLDSSDRGTILAALRAIGRISMNMTQMNRLGNVPAHILRNITSWLLLNDDELMDACLDFLYQYTAVSSNVERLVQSLETEHLVSHLVRLLSHGAKRGYRDLILQPERKIPATEEVLPLPPDLLTQLVETDEPERCYSWLRCFFEEDPDSSITQIAIWQAYQSSFLQPVQEAKRKMLGAAEFIRNVTHVYHSAGAQIQKEQTPQGEVQKFIIKGIRPRVRPISPDGHEFFCCQWKVPSPSRPSAQCGVFFGSAEKMYNHILEKHLGEAADGEGQVINKKRECQCLWDDCRQFSKPTAMPLLDFMRHIKTHAVAAEADYQPRKAHTTHSSHTGKAASETNHQQQQQQQQRQQQQQPGQQTPQPPSAVLPQGHRNSVPNGGDVTTGGGSSLQTPGPTPAQTPGSAAGLAGTGPGAAGSGSNGAGGSGGSNSNGGSSSHKRPKRSYIVPAKTISIAYEETATMRDERNPHLPPQAAGIPLSAVLVLRNIARNTGKIGLEDNYGNGDPMDVDSETEPGGWNERLFRPILPRLYEIMSENRALASYITSLFQLIGEER